VYPVNYHGKSAAGVLCSRKSIDLEQPIAESTVENGWKAGAFS
jgi:hypothetical protein